MGRFFEIQPAPQTLEGLDAWGALDSLPHSLDSAVWQGAGVWGLEAQAGAAASAQCSGSVTRSLSAQGRAQSGGSAALICGLVKVLGGEARARASSSLALGFSGWGWTQSRSGAAPSWHQTGGADQQWQRMDAGTEAREDWQAGAGAA